jgi:hypothetical protein
MLNAAGDDEAADSEGMSVSGEKVSEGERDVR